MNGDGEYCLVYQEGDSETKDCLYCLTRGPTSDEIVDFGLCGEPILDSEDCCLLKVGRKFKEVVESLIEQDDS